MSIVLRKEPKYYKGYTDSIKKYQMSEKYKVYKRKYETNYRQEHRIMVNYLSWRSMTKPTMVQEMEYLLKRFLK
jgi:KaiC/GvpD/RAD55 family RecA-like ATPase